MAGGAVREERIDLLRTQRQEEGACQQAAVAADDALSDCGHAPPCATTAEQRAHEPPASPHAAGRKAAAAHYHDQAAAAATVTSRRRMRNHLKCGGVPAAAGKEIATKLPDAAARCEAGAVHQGKRVLIAADNELQLDGGRAMKDHGSAGAADTVRPGVVAQVAIRVGRWASARPPEGDPSRSGRDG